MSHSISDSPLGQQTQYVSQYAPELLFPIPRHASRAKLGINESLPFFGCDIWTGYEISWLNEKGKPRVAVAEFTIPCDSPNIIESKSFKLYLNSLNQTRFKNIENVKNCIQADLSKAAGAMIDVDLQSLERSNLGVVNAGGKCLDDLDIEVGAYHPDANYLSLAAESSDVKEQLYSHLLKSNCPVTGQPDWASVFIEYEGKKINHEGLLRYIISFREHQDFHEHCVERIFTDIMQQCSPKSLSVYARYTRRGGLDINPFRTSNQNEKPSVRRLVRQ